MVLSMEYNDRVVPTMAPGRKNISHTARGNNIINDGAAIKSHYHKDKYSFTRDTKMFTNYATIGTIMCTDNKDWMNTIKMRKGVSNFPNVVFNNNVMTRTGRISGGSYGDVWQYMDKTTTKKCALKIMKTGGGKKATIPSMNTGGVSGFNNIPGFNLDTDKLTMSHATYVSKLCNLIVYTKFFLDENRTIYQIMEMGTGTAYDSARDRNISTETFVQFCIDVCRCIIKAKLAYCDTKLHNIIYTNCKEPDYSPFRLIDIDSIVPCMMPNSDAVLDTETLKMKIPPSTYPIINYKKIECPAIIVLQTWYSFMVSIILYQLSYMKHPNFNDIQYALSCNNPYFETKNYDQITQQDIFSDDHPMMKVIKDCKDDIDLRITKSIFKMKRDLTEIRQNKIYSCGLIRNSTNAQSKTGDNKSQIIEEYKNEGKYLYWMRGAVITNLTGIQKAYGFKDPTRLHEYYDGDRWKNIHGY